MQLHCSWPSFLAAGLGKTLLLRDMARHLADEAGLAVVVVDTSLEIGGGCGEAE
jgi:stage III sporulation protein SpoIIIAA